MDKKVIVIVTIILLILGSLGIYMVFKGDKSGILTLEETNFTITNSEGDEDSVGRVEFKKSEIEDVSLEEFLTKTEYEFLEDKNGEIKGVESAGSTQTLLKEYAVIALGEGVQCDLDEGYGDGFQECFNRVNTLLSNSNEDYNIYVDKGIEELEESIVKKEELIKKIKGNVDDEEVSLAVDYLYRLNKTYMENIKELKQLRKDVGKLSLEEMMEKVGDTGSKYQTQDPQLELKLIQYINFYTK